MSEQVRLIQCQDCHAWLSPHALFCPTCGIAGPESPLGPTTRPPDKASAAAWRFVRWFWTLAFLALVVGVVLT